MLEKRILDLSPIGKKLGGPYLVLGRHLGFWPLDPSGFTFFLGDIFFSKKYIIMKIFRLVKFIFPGDAPTPLLPPGLIVMGIDTKIRYRYFSIPG